MCTFMYMYKCKVDLGIFKNEESKKWAASTSTFKIISKIYDFQLRWSPYLLSLMWIYRHSSLSRSSRLKP